MKLFKILSLIFVVSFIFAPKAHALAQTLYVDCSQGCVKSGTDPLFSVANDGYWLPGVSLTKIINLKNSGTQIKEMGIRASRTSVQSDLEDVLRVEILNTKTMGIVWFGKLHDFYNQNKISMGMFNPGENINFNFKVSMDASAGNHYQGLRSVFDLILGFWEQEPVHTAKISGFKYFDWNGNNRWDGWVWGEYRINGWMIFIDKNNNKRFDWGERFDFTKGFYFFPLGNYLFDKLVAGNYNICEMQLPGWESSLVNHSVCQSITLGVGENKIGVNFGNHFIFPRR